MGLAPYGGKNNSLLKQLSTYEWTKVIKGKIYCNPNYVYPRDNTIGERIRFAVKWIFYTVRSFLEGIGSTDEHHFKFPIVFNKPARSKNISLPDTYYSEIAYFAQKKLEEAIVESVGYYKEKTGHENICTAGGVALNIDANSRLYTDLKFKNIFTQPAASDTGIPLGNALFAYYELVDYQTKPWVMDHAYLGAVYSGKEIVTALSEMDLDYQYREDIVEATAKLLAENKIIGWFNGASEYGPRALGNRSIIMSPLGDGNKDVLNLKVKKRESFRPFAPITLASEVHKFFDLPAKDSKFMLLVAKVKKEYLGKVPAITHVDQTARVQTLVREVNQETYDLINKFGEITGIPVLLNTSFNIAGEPIIETPMDAIKCFKSGGLDYLVMGNYLCFNRLDTSAPVAENVKEYEKNIHPPLPRADVGIAKDSFPNDLK